MIQGSQIFPDRNIDSSGQAGDDKRWAGRALSIERYSPSAMIQWAKLPSAPLLSISLSTVASSVAGSRTWSYITGSVSEAILSSVAVTVDGSLVAAGFGFPSAVAQALAPCSREMVSWALGPEWG